MKLLIDLPEEKYEWIKKNNPNVDTNSIVGALANGTPIKTVTNAEEAKAYPISEDIRKVKKIAEILKKYESEEEE